MELIDGQDEIEYIQDNIQFNHDIILSTELIEDTINGYIKYVNMNPGVFISDRDAVYYIIGYLVSLGYNNIEQDDIYYIIEYDFYYLESKGLIT